VSTFTPSFMDELKSRADIVSVVSEHVVLRKMGRSHKGLCPFHKERSPSFTVRADPPMFHCFGCGVGGDIVEFVKLKEGLSFKDAVESLARRFGVQIPDTREESPEDRMRVEVEPVLEAAAKLFEQWFWVDTGRRAREYLAGRKFSKKTLEFIRAGATRDAWEDLVRALKVQFREELIEMSGLAIRGQRSTTVSGTVRCFRSSRIADVSSPSAPARSTPRTNRNI
jgi:DNA primase